MQKTNSIWLEYVVLISLSLFCCTTKLYALTNAGPSFVWSIARVDKSSRTPDGLPVLESLDGLPGLDISFSINTNQFIPTQELVLECVISNRNSTIVEIDESSTLSRNVYFYGENGPFSPSVTISVLGVPEGYGNRSAMPPGSTYVMTKRTRIPEENIGDDDKTVHPMGLETSFTLVIPEEDGEEWYFGEVSVTNLFVITSEDYKKPEGEGCKNSSEDKSLK